MENKVAESATFRHAKEAVNSIPVDNLRNIVLLHIKNSSFDLRSRRELMIAIRKVKPKLGKWMIYPDEGITERQAWMIIEGDWMKFQLPLLKSAFELQKYSEFEGQNYVLSSVIFNAKMHMEPKEWQELSERCKNTVGSGIVKSMLLFSGFIFKQISVAGLIVGGEKKKTTKRVLRSIAVLGAITLEDRQNIFNENYSSIKNTLAPETSMENLV